MMMCVSENQGFRFLAKSLLVLHLTALATEPSRHHTHTHTHRHTHTHTHTQTYREIIVREQEQVSERVFFKLIPQFRDDCLIVEGVDQLRLLLLQIDTTEGSVFIFFV